jgi:hypothetical protein
MRRAIARPSQPSPEAPRFFAWADLTEFAGQNPGDAAKLVSKLLVPPCAPATVTRVLSWLRPNSPVWAVVADARPGRLSEIALEHESIVYLENFIFGDLDAPFGEFELAPGDDARVALLEWAVWKGKLTQAKEKQWDRLAERDFLDRVMAADTPLSGRLAVVRAALCSTAKTLCHSLREREARVFRVALEHLYPTTPETLYLNLQNYARKWARINGNEFVQLLVEGHNFFPGQDFVNTTMGRFNMDNPETRRQIESSLSKQRRIDTGAPDPENERRKFESDQWYVLIAAFNNAGCWVLLARKWQWAFFSLACRFRPSLIETALTRQRVPVEHYSQLIALCQKYGIDGAVLTMLYSAGDVAGAVAYSCQALRERLLAGNEPAIVADVLAFLKKSERTPAQ